MNYLAKTQDNEIEIGGKYLQTCCILISWSKLRGEGFHFCYNIMIVIPETDRQNMKKIYWK